MMKSAVIAALFAAATAKQNVRQNLGGHKIIDVHRDHVTDDVLALLQEHEGDHLGLNDDGFFSIKLSPEGVETVNAHGLEFEDTTEQWVNHLERNLESICSGTAAQCASQADFHENYQTLEAVDARVQNIVASTSLATRKVLGKTFEGRDQYVVEIGDQSKPLALTMCTIHAREWLAPMYCTHMIEQLVANGGHPLLDDFSFAVIYMGNPDGYKHSIEVNSMWRKTRNTNAGSSCIGTDPNRNYEDHHCGTGTSGNPCSDIYCGPAPYSTPEVFNLNEYAKANKDRIITWIDYHSFASVWLSPLGYKRGTPPAVDYNRMAACMDAAAKGATAAEGERFSYGPAANVLGPAAGASDDNFYFTHGVIYSFTVELRGRSFQPSPSNIKPSNNEIFAGTVAQMECIADIELRGLTRNIPEGTTEEGDPIFVTENTGISMTQFVAAALGVGILSGLTVFGAMTYRNKKAAAEGAVRSPTV